MTSLSSVLAAFAIILIDLIGRAGLDKMLALTGNPAMVALWAQLQSVVELVASVAIVGVLQGLTVLVTQVRTPSEERYLLNVSLKLALGISLLSGFLVVLLSPWLINWFARGEIQAVLLLMASIAGCLMVIPATLNAYWLGKHQQLRMLKLAFLTGMVWLVLAVSAWLGLSLPGMLLLQCTALLLISAGIFHILRGLLRKPEESGASVAAEVKVHIIAA